MRRRLWLLIPAGFLIVGLATVPVWGGDTATPVGFSLTGARSSTGDQDAAGTRPGETAAVVFAQRSGRRLRLDVFRPTGATAPAAVVVLVHGGAWRTGHRSAWTPTARALADAGFAAVTVDYRLSGEARFPAALDDVADAIAHVRASAATLGVDGNRVVVMGGSAGGHLALLAATTGVPVVGAVALSPPTDLTALAAIEPDAETALCSTAGRRCRRVGLRAAVSAWLGCEPSACPVRAAAASPLQQVDGGDPPSLVVHADDEVIPLSQSVALHRRLRAADVDSTLVVRAGRRHGSQLRAETWPEILAFLATVTAR